MSALVALRGKIVHLEPLTSDVIGDLLVAATEPAGASTLTLVPQDLATMTSYVAAALADQAAGVALPFVIRAATGRVVGSTRFLDLAYWASAAGPPGHSLGPVADVPDVAEIGATWLAPSARRTGVNTEAKLLLLTHAFDSWNVHRVTFKTDARNAASRAAIESLGARFEGIRRAHQRAVDGGIRDTAYFSILRAEWPDVRDQLVGRLHSRY